MWRLYCITVLGLCMYHNTNAQFNLKVGYNLGVVDAPVHEAIMEQHNLLMDSYTVPFSSLKSLHGFEFGIRQRIEAVSIEAGWKLQRNMLTAEGKRENGQAFENELTYGVQAISAGLFFHAGPISFGGTLDYNMLKMKMEFAEPDLSESFKDKMFSSDFSVSFTLPTEGLVTLAFRPYVRVNYGSYDITELDANLNYNLITDPLREDFISYGISVIVYNGYQ